MTTVRRFFFFSLLFFQTAGAQERHLPLWEYGAGFGYVRYEQYPASSQYSDLALPFPTFQYRGKIVRADDREGAKIYFLKSKNWYVELSGSGYPSLDSSKNDARTGMETIPWMLLLGPQIVYKLSDNTDLRLSLFQATTSDFKMTRFAGTRYRMQMAHRFGDQSTQGSLYLSLNGGSQEFMSVFFDVPSQYANAERPFYDSRGGLLSYNLSYFQSWNSGRAAFYIGGEISKYDISINRASPLHKSDSNITYIVGLTYRLGESERSAIPDEETRGLIKRVKFLTPQAE